MFINDLPDEMLLEILEKIQLHELVVSCSKTCFIWRDLIAQHILEPKLWRLANVNHLFKRVITDHGWTEEKNSNESELIIFLYQKYEYFSSM